MIKDELLILELEDRMWTKKDEDEAKIKAWQRIFLFFFVFCQCGRRRDENLKNSRILTLNTNCRTKIFEIPMDPRRRRRRRRPRNYLNLTDKPKCWTLFLLQLFIWRVYSDSFQIEYLTYYFEILFFSFFRRSNGILILKF